MWEKICATTQSQGEHANSTDSTPGLWHCEAAFLYQLHHCAVQRESRKQGIIAFKGSAGTSTKML